MTVLVVLEKLQAGEITMNTRYTVSEYAWREHGAPSDGSHMFLPVNSERQRPRSDARRGDRVGQRRVRRAGRRHRRLRGGVRAHR